MKVRMVHPDELTNKGAPWTSGWLLALGRALLLLLLVRQTPSHFYSTALLLYSSALHATLHTQSGRHCSALDL